MLDVGEKRSRLVAPVRARKCTWDQLGWSRRQQTGREQALALIHLMGCARIWLTEILFPCCFLHVHECTQLTNFCSKLVMAIAWCNLSVSFRMFESQQCHIHTPFSFLHCFSLHTAGWISLGPSCYLCSFLSQQTSRSKICEWQLKPLWIICSMTKVVVVNAIWINSSMSSLFGSLSAVQWASENWF